MFEGLLPYWNREGEMKMSDHGIALTPLPHTERDTLTTIKIMAMCECGFHHTFNTPVTLEYILEKTDISKHDS